MNVAKIRQIKTSLMKIVFSKSCRIIHMYANNTIIIRIYLFVKVFGAKDYIKIVENSCKMIG